MSYGACTMEMSSQSSFHKQPIDHIKIRVTVSTEVCYTPSQCEATVSSIDECVILPTHPLFLSDTQCAQYAPHKLRPVTPHTNAPSVLCVPTLVSRSRVSN